MGVLAFLGGVDEWRVRLGGRVVHGKEGEGWVVDLLKSETRAVVQFPNQSQAVSCLISELSVVSFFIRLMLLRK